MILAEFGQAAPAETDKSALIKGLQTHIESLAAKKRRGLLIIDEAQNLPLDALEEIRMLSNFQEKDRNLVQIILVGQPELRARMKDPRCLQIAQRVATNYHIAALSLEETRAYILYRLRPSGGNGEIFSADALDMVFQLSRGIPRSINLVCDSALIYGFSEEARIIDTQVVAKAAKQLDLIGLVNIPSSESLPAAAPAARGNGNGKALVEGFGEHEKSIEVFLNELTQEVKRIGEQVNSVRGSTLEISAAVEKFTHRDRTDYEKLQADSARLKVLQELLDEGSKG